MIRQALARAAALSVTGLLCLGQPGHAQSLPPTAAGGGGPPPSITLRGSCVLTTQPDRARLMLAAVQTAPDPARAASAASAQLASLQQQIKALALENARIAAPGVTLSRVVEEDQARRRHVLYAARAQVTVETAQIARLGEVMAAAAKLELAEIGGIETFLSAPARARIVSACLPQAAADARARATELLGGIDARVGGVLRVDGYDVDGDTGGAPPRPMLRMAAAAPMAAPDVSPAELSITVGTTISFAIEGPTK